MKKKSKWSTFTPCEKVKSYPRFSVLEDYTKSSGSKNIDANINIQNFK